MKSLATRISITLLLIGLISCSASSAEQTEANTVTKSEQLPEVQSLINEEIHSVMPLDSPEVEMIPVNTLLGKIVQSKDVDFVRIDRKYTAKPAIYLRKEAYTAFEKMYAAAKLEGISLEIISATRNFKYQKGIWERKWTGVTKVGGKNLAISLPDPVERARAILRYSSMPGTSRHHWGTDIDLNSLNNSWFASGQGKKVYTWLQAHAAEFGYCQTYTHMDESRPRGYQEEKWHWSYMPIASKFLASYLTHVHVHDITGFKGAEAAKGMNVIQDFVGGVGPRCREWK